MPSEVASYVVSPPPTRAAQRPIPGIVPADFVPVEAVVCDPFADGEVSADRWVTFHENHFRGDLVGLVEQVNASSDRETLFPGGCGDEYSLAPVEDMWLVDATGHAMEPSYPLNDCGLPNQGAVYTARQLAEVSTVEHRVQIGDYGVEMWQGCSPTFSAPIAGQRDLRLELFSGPSSYCRFDTTGSVPLFGGVTGYSDTILSELVVRLPSSGPCAESAGTVLTSMLQNLGPNSGPVPVSIEVDGCRRLIADGFVPVGPVPEDVLEELLG